MEQTAFSQLAATLTALLGLQRQPVGVHFCATAEEYQASPFRQPPLGLPYCTAVAKATTGGCYKLDLAHCRCGAAATALGMQQVTASRASGQVYGKMQVYRDEDVCRQVAQDMVYCQQQQFGVEISPLERCNASPQVALLIVPPHSAMRLLQGYAYHFGQLKQIKMAGMCGVCQECTSYPQVTGQMNVSLLCSGTRCVARWQPHELGVGIPYQQLAKVVDGLWWTVDPMEGDEEKARILADCARLGVEAPELNFHHNYFQHSYGTPETFAKRAARQKD